MRYICSRSEQHFSREENNQARRPVAPAESIFTREETYSRTRRPVAFAETIVPPAYTSEEFFAVERERVFASGWVVVGPAAQLRDRGELLVADVSGRSVIVVRGHYGELSGYFYI